MLNSLMTASKLLRWWAATVLTIGACFLGFNCAPFSPPEFAPLASTSSNSESSVETDLPVSLLSSEQILKAMVSATGIEGFSDPTAADDLIMRTYAERSGSLPSEQSLKQVTSPMLIAVANLASAVCAKAVSRDAAIGNDLRSTRLFFREVDFSRGLESVQPDAMALAFERLARNAWRRDVTSTEIEAISAFATEFRSGVSVTDSAQTRLLAISVCTSVLSSIDGLTY